MELLPPSGGRVGGGRLSAAAVFVRATSEIDEATPTDRRMRVPPRPPSNRLQLVPKLPPPRPPQRAVSRLHANLQTPIDQSLQSGAVARALQPIVAEPSDAIDFPQEEIPTRHVPAVDLEQREAPTRRISSGEYPQTSSARQLVGLTTNLSKSELLHEEPTWPGDCASGTQQKEQVDTVASGVEETFWSAEPRYSNPGAPATSAETAKPELAERGQRPRVRRWAWLILSAIGVLLLCEVAVKWIVPALTSSRDSQPAAEHLPRDRTNL